jgi:hypothetical protein
MAILVLLVCSIHARDLCTTANAMLVFRSPAIERRDCIIHRDLFPPSYIDTTMQKFVVTLCEDIV